jgi:hypothetical protein
MVLSVVLLSVYKIYKNHDDNEEDKGIPYYSTANNEVTSAAARIMHDYECKSCHSLWATRDFTQAVPAPALDGEGSFRSEEWLFEYFSAKVPQDILPTRLKPQYRHPSLSELPETDRIALAKYMASLKVEDWYYEETKKRRFEKLTGKRYQANAKTEF